MTLTWERFETPWVTGNININKTERQLGVLNHLDFYEKKKRLLASGATQQHVRWGMIVVCKLRDD